MKKSVIAMAVTAAIAAPLTAQAEESWFGFSQITAEMGDGVGVNNGTANNTDYSNTGLQFGADRIRIGYKASEGDAFAKLQLDFLNTGSNIAPNVIKDAVVGYQFSPSAKFSAGLFKTPVGMDFNTSGKKLDITKRGMEKGLVLERSAGGMISGDLGGGVGYDVGIFNPTTRSSVVTTTAGLDGSGNAGGTGEDMAYAARVSYDMGDMMHAEFSYGSSANAGGSAADQDTEDYTVMDLGVAYMAGPLTAKFEYISGTSVRGVDGWDESVWYLHGGYMLSDSTEVVARHYAGTNDNNGNETELSNTYVGANFFLNKAARIQVNYVVAGGDTDGAYGGARGGYDADALLTQFQYSF